MKVWEKASVHELYARMHLQTAWKQRVLELYELQITWMQWGVGAHARKELQ